MKIGFIQAKGGQGTTAVAAMTALTLAQDAPTLLVGKEEVDGPWGIDDLREAV